jgi:hypothetical protein
VGEIQPLPAISLWIIRNCPKITTSGATIACKTFILNEIAWNIVLILKLFCIVFIHLAEQIGILESFADTPPDGLGSTLERKKFCLLSKFYWSGRKKHGVGLLGDRADGNGGAN